MELEVLLRSRDMVVAKPLFDSFGVPAVPVLALIDRDNRVLDSVFDFSSAACRASRLANIETQLDTRPTGALPSEGGSWALFSTRSHLINTSGGLQHKQAEPFRGNSPGDTPSE